MKNKQLYLSRNGQYLNVLLSLSLTMTLFLSQSYAQTSSIHGRVNSSRYPIPNVAITFMDNADTATKYTALTDATGNYQIDLITSVESGVSNLPDEFELAQNYPNPFSSLTSIPYTLNKGADVRITIFDVLGREVRNFAVGRQTAGSHNIVWDGLNDFGKRVANGIYFYRLQAGDESRAGKMLFNSGGKGALSLPGVPPSQMPKLNRAMGRNALGGTYTILVENSDDTFPSIVSQQIENVPVKNDTTINFSVNAIASAIVDLDQVHQYIRGFGASNIILWRPDMTASEVETAFGKGEGQLGFSILRIMLEPDSGRWSLYIPAAKKAHEMGATIIAAPWYAPAEMVETVNGISRVRHDMYAEYAAHLDSFNTYMANNGVPLYGISVQNEPDITDQWTSWTSEEMFTFMRDYAHAITGTNVMAPESFQFRRQMSDPILNDSVACANTDIVCGHIYGDGLAPYPLAEEKGKEVWMTEHLSGENNSANEWNWALPVAREINDVMRADMSAYVWWYLVRYYGPIDDGSFDARSKKGTITKKGYVMSQFSRFIRPGYYRVDSRSWPPTGSPYVTAYNDSTSSGTVIVAINSGSAPLELIIHIKNGFTSTFTPYTTSENKNVVQGANVEVSDNRLIYNMEASSITTFVSE